MASHNWVKVLVINPRDPRLYGQILRIDREFYRDPPDPGSPYGVTMVFEEGLSYSTTQALSQVILIDDRNRFTIPMATGLTVKTLPRPIKRIMKKAGLRKVRSDDSAIKEAKPKSSRSTVRRRKRRYDPAE